MTKYQVTLSDGSNPNRAFAEVGQYATLDDARAAAMVAVKGQFNAADFRLVHTPDDDFIGCEDWFGYAADNSKAIILAINCLPLVSVNAPKFAPDIVQVHAWEDDGGLVV